MLIFISLFLLCVAGVAACGLPPGLFNLESTLSSGKLQLWMVSVKAFGIPLSLLLLKFTKNHWVKLATALWGLFLTSFSLILVFKISDMAPGVNFYGILFVVAVLICSMSVAIFSLVDLSDILKRHLANTKSPIEASPKQDLSQVEGTYQAPTNPS
jgi:thiol:disulfide interchange protein